MQECLSLEQESIFSLWNVSKEVNKQDGYRYVDGELKVEASFGKEQVGRWAVKASDTNQSNKFTSLISRIFDFQAGAKIQAG